MWQALPLILYGIDRFAKGIGAFQNKSDVENALGSLGDIYQQKKGMIGNTYQIGKDKATLGFNTGMLNLKQKSREVSTAKNTMNMKSNMATIGGIDTKISNVNQNIYDMYKLKSGDYASNMDSLMNTLNRSLLGAEEEYEQQKYQIGQTPTTFWGGVFS